MREVKEWEEKQTLTQFFERATHEVSCWSLFISGFGLFNSSLYSILTEDVVFSNDRHWWIDSTSSDITHFNSSPSESTLILASWSTFDWREMLESSYSFLWFLCSTNTCLWKTGKRMTDITVFTILIILDFRSPANMSSVWIVLKTQRMSAWNVKREWFVSRRMVWEAFFGVAKKAVKGHTWVTGIFLPTLNIDIPRNKKPGDYQTMNLDNCFFLNT